ncbi:MAG: ATP synthase subunit I [Nitrospiria bacterium]
MTTATDRPATDDPARDQASPFDRDLFLLKSNATLKQIERTSLVILVVGVSLGFLISKKVGSSLSFGGGLAMLHFRSLHRMFQKRVLDPPSWLKTKFIYSVTLFLMIFVFFWVIQWQAISTTSVVLGFLLMTGSFLFDTSRQRR